MPPGCESGFKRANTTSFCFFPAGFDPHQRSRLRYSFTDMENKGQKVKCVCNYSIHLEFRITPLALYPTTYISLCLPMYLRVSICLSAYLSIYLHICLPSYLSAYLSVCVCLPIYKPIHPSIRIMLARLNAVCSLRFIVDPAQRLLNRLIA